MKNQKGSILEGLLIVFIICFLGSGWVLNIVKLTKLNFKPSYKVEIIRSIGVILPPIGSVLGWMSIKDN